MDLYKILEAAVRRDASDLILRDGLPPMVRVYGELSPLEEFKRLAPEELQQAANTFLHDDTQRMRFATERHADLAFEQPDLGRFRINVYRQRGRIGIVLRIIPHQIRTFEELNLPPVIERIANERRGLVLVTGPTGNGKTTTLAAILSHINRTAARHIITIEDPIEYVHENARSVVSQREIGADVDDFPSALRVALRQNPDVIMVGEMRDTETIETSIMAAETGHLVLSSLHTIDAAETTMRIVGGFPEHQRDQARTILANVLRGVVSLRLLPRADGRGMVPAVEVMVGSVRVREYVEKNRSRELREVIAQGQSAYGMQTFDQSLMDLFRHGTITYEEALAHCSNPSDFELQARGIGAHDWGEFETRATKADERTAKP
jgi:twitching motility protein PilT